jgi:sugar phosphate isomerase/epimerase
MPAATRREFLATAAALGAAAAGACVSTPKPDARPFEISLAQWSLHRAIEGKTLDAADFPAAARRDYDLDAVEYVNRFYKEKAADAAYWPALRRRADDAGVRGVLVMVDGEGSLGDAASRGAAVENHRKWLDVAAVLGCRAIRVNAHGSGTPEEQAKRVAESLVELAGFGAPLGLSVLVENHGGLSSNGAWLAGVMRLANHPGVGTLPDFGNFTIRQGETYDRYRGVAELMPFAKGVSAKSYAFDADGGEETMDFPRLVKIVVDAGYRGHVGIEYEGEKHTEPEGIRLTKALLERLRPHASAARA